MTITIGQRILAAVLAQQLGITTDRALKHYVQGRELDPSWDEAGEALLKSAVGSTSVPESFAPRSGPKSMTITIGQRILAAVLAHQLGISMDRALRLYVQGRDIDPSYEELGEMLLSSSIERASVQESLAPRSGPHN